LWAMAQQVAQAALAWNFPEGVWGARADALASALICSWTAWPRWWASAWSMLMVPVTEIA
jgi:hypothetical protein